MLTFDYGSPYFWDKVVLTNSSVGAAKVIIEKSRGEVSLMEQDTISYIFVTSKCATNYRDIFEVYNGFIGQKILKLWRQESWPFGPNPAQISIPVP